MCPACTAYSCEHVHCLGALRVLQLRAACTATLGTGPKCPMSLASFPTHHLVCRPWPWGIWSPIHSPRLRSLPWKMRYEYWVAPYPQWRLGHVTPWCAWCKRFPQLSRLWSSVCSGCIEGIETLTAHPTLYCSDRVCDVHGCWRRPSQCGGHGDGVTAVHVQRHREPAVR